MKILTPAQFRFYTASKRFFASLDEPEQDECFVDAQEMWRGMVLDDIGRRERGETGDPESLN